MEPNEHDRNDGFDVTSINRRKVLQGVGAAGAIGVLGTGPAAAEGDKPCFKDFECKEGTYVKIEFVEVYEDTDDDGEEELVDCYFEEETDTGLIEVTDWESKDGEECEPISVTLSYADGFTASKLTAYGGKGCDPEHEPGESYNSELSNDGGNQAAISNLQFCIVEKEIFGSGEVAFGYEDLPMDSSDWDVNDFVVDLNTSFTAKGTSSGGFPEVTQLTFDIIPQALGAGDDHEWRLEFLDDAICEGSYTLTQYSPSGTDYGTDTGDIPGTVTVFEHTQDLFDENLSNAELPDNVGECKKPNMWARLTVTFDSECPLDIPTAPDDLDVNASDLFFDPVLENLTKDEVVDRGDMRLVAVPDTWEWPLGAVQIWDAYDEVDEDNSVPVYTTEDWYDGGHEEESTTNCNFEPNDDDEIEEV